MEPNITSKKISEGARETTDLIKDHSADLFFFFFFYPFSFLHIPLKIVAHSSGPEPIATLWYHPKSPHRWIGPNVEPRTSTGGPICLSVTLFLILPFSWMIKSKY